MEAGGGVEGEAATTREEDSNRRAARELVRAQKAACALLFSAPIFKPISTLSLQ
jgi:hypothetical protein